MIVVAEGPALARGPTAPLPAGRDLWPRVASAIVLAPLAIAAAYLGGTWFIGFWLLAAIMVLVASMLLYVGVRGRAPGWADRFSVPRGHV